MFEGLFQPTHLLLVLLLAFVLFGAAKLSEVGGALGKSIREFRHAAEEPRGTTTRNSGSGRYCPSCGHAVAPDDCFCAECGGVLTPQMADRTR